LRFSSAIPSPNGRPDLFLYRDPFDLKAAHARSHTAARPDLLKVVEKLSAKPRGKKGTCQIAVRPCAMQMPSGSLRQAIRYLEEEVQCAYDADSLSVGDLAFARIGLQAREVPVEYIDNQIRGGSPLGFRGHRQPLGKVGIHLHGQRKLIPGARFGHGHLAPDSGSLNGKRNLTSVSFLRINRLCLGFALLPLCAMPGEPAQEQIHLLGRVAVQDFSYAVQSLEHLQTPTEVFNVTVVVDCGVHRVTRLAPYLGFFSRDCPIKEAVSQQMIDDFLGLFFGDLGV
jgi:hypothetical protein